MIKMLTRETVLSLTYDNTTSEQLRLLKETALALLDVDEAVRQQANTPEQSTLQCLLQREKEWCKVMEEYREQLRRVEAERDAARHERNEYRDKWLAAKVGAEAGGVASAKLRAKGDALAEAAEHLYNVSLRYGDEDDDPALHELHSCRSAISDWRKP